MLLRWSFATPLFRRKIELDTLTVWELIIRLRWLLRRPAFWEVMYQLNGLHVTMKVTTYDVNYSFRKETKARIALLGQQSASIVRHLATTKISSQSHPLIATWLRQCMFWENVLAMDCFAKHDHNEAERQCVRPWFVPSSSTLSPCCFMFCCALPSEPFLSNALRNLFSNLIANVLQYKNQF